jgi:hypothetical protein
MGRSVRLLIAVLGAGLLACACDEKKVDSDSARADAGAATDKFAAADPKLERALKAAAAADSAQSDNGPPPGGVFGPGVADRRHPKSAPTKVDVIADGDEPRIDLSTLASDASAANPAAAVAGPAMIELAMQVGPRSALPTVDFGLALTPAKKDEGGDGWLVATIKKSAPSKDQYGQLPPEIDKEIAALQGSQIRLPFGGAVPESSVQTVLAKGAPVELERLALNGAEALTLDTIPFPTKPVGVGAQWIAETRMPWSGVDVVAYRAFRVKSIEGSRVHLTVDVKGYSAEKEPTLQGLPKGATLEQFDAEAQGEIEMVRGEGLARRATVQERVAMLFRTPGPAGQTDPSGPNGEPGQPGEPAQNMGSFQAQAAATFVRGDDLRAAVR